MAVEVMTSLEHRAEDQRLYGRVWLRRWSTGRKARRWRFLPQRLPWSLAPGPWAVAFMAAEVMGRPMVAEALTPDCLEMVGPDADKARGNGVL